MAQAITRDELKAKLDRSDDFLLVEALPAEMFARVHLPGAINLPPDQITERAPRQFPNKQQEIVVYCADSG